MIDLYAPPELAMEGDPIGLHLGNPEKEVSRLFLALELNPAVVNEALAYGADMIVVHHTPFFAPVTQLRDDDRGNTVLLELIRNNVALFTAHTNLDAVAGGVSDVLAEILELDEAIVLQPIGKTVVTAGLGRIGSLRAPVTLEAYVGFISQKLGVDGVRYVGEKSRQIGTVACCGGSGAFLVKTAAERGADLLVTSDVKHHDAALAESLGLALVDAGHFATEAPMVRRLESYLIENTMGLSIAVSTIYADPFTYIKS